MPVSRRYIIIFFARHHRWILTAAWWSICSLRCSSTSGVSCCSSADRVHGSSQHSMHTSLCTAWPAALHTSANCMYAHTSATPTLDAAPFTRAVHEGVPVIELTPESMAQWEMAQVININKVAHSDALAIISIEHAISNCLHRKGES